MIYAAIGATMGIVTMICVSRLQRSSEVDYLQELRERTRIANEEFAKIDLNRTVVDRPVRIGVEPGDEIGCYRDADGYLRRTVVKGDKTAS
jgi:hypothetical protein